MQDLLFMCPCVTMNSMSDTRAINNYNNNSQTVVLVKDRKPRQQVK